MRCLENYMNGDALPWPVLLTLLIWTLLMTGCTKPAQRGELLEKYSRADCIPVRLAAESPSTREWDHRIITRAAGAVTVRGAQGPSGRITAIFASEQEPRGRQLR